MSEVQSSSLMTILFFGQLRELFATNVLHISPSSIVERPLTIKALRTCLQARGELWAEYLQTDKCLVALNQTISHDDANIREGDEIAFFPPVTGG